MSVEMIMPLHAGTDLCDCDTNNVSKKKAVKAARDYRLTVLQTPTTAATEDVQKEKVGPKRRKIK